MRSVEDLRDNPSYGASWEGFAIEHVVRMAGSSYEAFAWETLAGAMLDLLLERGSRKIGFEMKASETPSTTKSMRIAAADLNLERIFVIHPGTVSHELDVTIHVVALRDLKRLVVPFLEV